MDEVECLFLGTGTSAGVPMIGCHCAVCESPDAQDKRTRASVVISYGDCHVLIDATPELRLQCVANQVDRVDALVMTHAHADHIMGLDDVRRFNALRGGPLDVWADTVTHEVLQRCFGYAFRAPDPAQKVFRPHLRAQTIDGAFELSGETWTPIRLLHGQMPVLGFRVGRLAYCTDVSRIPPESMPLLRDLDVLVLDGLQWKPHSTHFSLGEAIEVATELGARRTLFTHIAHGLPHAQTNSQLPAGMRLAHDGMRVRARLR